MIEAKRTNVKLIDQSERHYRLKESDVHDNPHWVHLEFLSEIQNGEEEDTEKAAEIPKYTVPPFFVVSVGRFEPSSNASGYITK